MTSNIEIVQSLMRRSQPAIGRACAQDSPKMSNIVSRTTQETAVCTTGPTP